MGTINVLLPGLGILLLLLGVLLIFWWERRLVDREILLLQVARRTGRGGVWLRGAGETFLDHLPDDEPAA